MVEVTAVSAGGSGVVPSIGDGQGGGLTGWVMVVCRFFFFCFPFRLKQVRVAARNTDEREPYFSVLPR